MEQRKKHLQCLLYFALLDKEFDASESNFIRQVGKRLQLSEEEIGIIISSKAKQQPELPEGEIQRYILFDDILNLVSIDGKITDKEEKEVKKVAEKLGFSGSMATDVIAKLKRHIELGFDSNQISHSIKNTLFSLTYNTNKNGKYSI